ncbi:unnamed protein product [Zymoseptoria tritici ST99CH_1A5]|uniref:Uncharacterized protein n=1 Tax=Zymoseptoria tritici ST99CH_1A5 TaxID=1276529 RepID=A0A1Y6M1S4_ZYMTR|nr:unnamed protein product [Zymoseptoria tritici ST99CH_1A5]
MSPSEASSHAPSLTLVILGREASQEEEEEEEEEEQEEDQESVEDDHFITSAKFHAIITDIFTKVISYDKGVHPAMQQCAAYYSHRRRVPLPALPATLPPLHLPPAPHMIDRRALGRALQEAVDGWWDEIIRADAEDLQAERRLLERLERMCEVNC